MVAIIPGCLNMRKRWAKKLISSCQATAVFGNIKQNKGFRRFYLRGIEKVNVEIGLLAIAHNLQRFGNRTGH